MLRIHSGPAFVPALAALGDGLGGARATRLYQKQPDGQWITDLPLAGSLSATSRSIEGPGANQTTASLSAMASGGQGALTLSWAKLSGGAITAQSIGPLTTAFNAAGLAEGESRTAIFRATVTDQAPDSVIAGEVEVSITRWSLPHLSAPASLTASTTLATFDTPPLTATRTGGLAPFTLAWSKRSGGAITALSPAALTTAFRASGLTTGEVRTAVFDLTVTDARGQTDIATVNVQITRRSPVTVTVLPGFITEKVEGNAIEPTSYTTRTAASASPSGGLAPYSFAWTLGPGSNLELVTPAAQSTRFRQTAPNIGNFATARCQVTDSLGATALSNPVTVNLV